MPRAVQPTRRRSFALCGAQRGCASGSGTDPAHGTPAGSGRTRAIAAIFPSRSPAWFARHRTVGALAADSATASAGSTAAAPRARIDPPGGRPVTLTAVHPLAPIRGHADMWQRELALIRQTLATVDGPQVAAGDFNASRDHRPFRDLLAAGFLDCADSGQSRSWPGFTWPAAGGCTRHAPRSRAGLADRHGAHDSRHTTARTDHHGVLAAIEFTQKT